MAKTPINQEEIFASDLLSTQANALTLNGLTSDSFLRADVDSTPWLDDDVSLGSEEKKFTGIWSYNINGTPCEYILFADRNNLPTVNSNGTSGFDLGSFTRYWRSVYTRNVYADTIYVTDILKPDGGKFSHKDLSDIGTNTHVDIDKHIAATNVHGCTPSNVANRIVSRDDSGDIYVSTMYGVANQAKYADLAEKYTTKDKQYSEGTVFSSSNSEYDVEICNKDLCENVIRSIFLKTSLFNEFWYRWCCFRIKRKIKL